METIQDFEEYSSWTWTPGLHKYPEEKLCTKDPSLFKYLLFPAPFKYVLQDQNQKQLMILLVQEKNHFHR